MRHSRETGSKLVRLVPSEKRILITKAIGEQVTRQMASGGWGSAVVKCGNWVKLDRSEDAEIRFQNFPDFSYAAVITDQAIAAHKAKRDAAEMVRKTEEERVQVKQRRERELADAQERKESDAWESVGPTTERMWPFVVEKAEAHMMPTLSAIAKEVMAISS
jgi:arginyl-tRNA synthetase